MHFKYMHMNKLLRYFKRALPKNFVRANKKKKKEDETFYWLLKLFCRVNASRGVQL